MALKLSYEEVVKFIEENSNSKLLTKEYLNGKTKMVFECECGETFITSFNSFKYFKKIVCNKCAFTKITLEDVKKYVKENSNSILLSEEYTGVKNKMLFECSCGNKFETTFDSFKNKKQTTCSVCSSNSKEIYNKFSYEYVYNFIKENSKCELLSKSYNNSKDKLEIKCSCGKIFYKNFEYFKNSKLKMCKDCLTKYKSETNKLSYEEVKQYIESFGNVLLSVAYENQYQDLLIKCKSCGEIYYQNFVKFKQSKNKLCKNCTVKLIGIKKAHEYEDVKKIIEENGVELLTKKEDYKNKNQPILLKCIKCGDSYFVDFNNFINRKKYNCNKCSPKSKGEEIISNILNKNKINYEPQKIFNSCKNKKHLPFDFYISDYKLLIEYDGEFHFHPRMLNGVDLKKAEDNLKIQQNNDRIKTEWAKINNIPLLRIPYWEFDNIEEIIVKELNLQNEAVVK